MPKQLMKPEQFTMDELVAEVDKLRQWRYEARERANEELPRDILLRLRQLERELNRRESEAELSPTARALAIGAQAVPRGVASLAGLPGDIVQMGKMIEEGTGQALQAYTPAIPRAWNASQEWLRQNVPGYGATTGAIGGALGGATEFAASVLPTSESINEQITNLPTHFGYNPLLRPGTTGERFLDTTIQGASSAAIPVKALHLATQHGRNIPYVTPAVKALTSPFVPSEQTLARQGLQRTLYKEAAAGAGAGAASQAIQEARRGVQNPNPLMDLVLQLGGGMAAGQLASGMGDVVQRMRASGSLNPDDWRFLYHTGQKLIEMMAGGEPQDRVHNYVMSRLAREASPELRAALGHAMYLQNLAPADWNPTLGQASGVPELLAFQKSAEPFMQEFIRELETEQIPAGGHAVRQQLYNQQGWQTPPGADYNRAAAEGNVPLPLEDVAQTYSTRLQGETAASQALGEAEQLPLAGALEALPPAKEAALARQESQYFANIMAENQRDRAARQTTAETTETLKRDVTRQGEAQLTARLERFNARVDRAIAKHQAYVDNQAARFKSGLQEPIDDSASRVIRQEYVQAYEDLMDVATYRYGNIPTANVAGDAGRLHQAIADMDAHSLREQTPFDMPTGPLQNFYEALRTRLGIDDPAVDLRPHPVLMDELRTLRTRIFEWQRDRAPTYQSNTLIDALNRTIENIAPADILEDLRATNAWYRQNIQKFTDMPGFDVLAKRTPRGYRETYMIHTRNPETGDIIRTDPHERSYAKPVAHIGQMLLADPIVPNLQSFFDVAGGSTQARQALVALLFNDFYISLGTDFENVGRNHLADFHRKHQGLFAMLRQNGMGDVEQAFADFRDVRQRLREFEDASDHAYRREREGQLKAAQDRLIEQQLDAIRYADQAQAGMTADQNTQNLRDLRDINNRDAAAISRKYDQQIAEVEAEMRQSADAESQRENLILSRYLSVDPEQVAGALAEQLRTNIPEKFAVNVRTMLNNVAGNMVAEEGVRKAVVAELYRAAGGDGQKFKANLHTYSTGLRAAGIDAVSQKILEDIADQLYLQERTLDPGTARAVRTTQRDEIFRGNNILTDIVAVSGFIGATIGALKMVPHMTQVGGPAAVAERGAQVLTYRAMGGGIGRAVARLIGAGATSGYNIRAAEFVKKYVFNPDFRQVVEDLDAYERTGPRTRAKLRAYRVAWGLAPRQEDEELFELPPHAQAAPETVRTPGTTPPGPLLPEEREQLPEFLRPTPPVPERRSRSGKLLPQKESGLERLRRSRSGKIID